MAKGKDLTVSKGNLERMPRPMGLFGDIDRMFDEFLSRRWPRPLTELAGEIPSVDVIDRDEEVVVRAAVPGYRKEDIEITVSGDLLTISGETKSEQKEEKGDYYRAEITRGAFSRTCLLYTSPSPRD